MEFVPSSITNSSYSWSSLVNRLKNSTSSEEEVREGFAECRETKTELFFADVFDPGIGQCEDRIELNGILQRPV